MQFFVATLTPFDARGRVDLGRLRAHVLWLSSQGVEGFVPTGSTGEFLYLTDREREAVHRTVLDAAGALPVYPCTWDPSPATAAFLSDAAREQGASGVLLPPPLHYDVEDEVVVRWFTEIAEKAALPVLGYHEPSLRASLSPQTYTLLRARETLAGMVDGSGDMFRARRMAQSDPGSIFLSNDAVMAQARQLPQVAGFISSIANVWPGLCMRLYKKGEMQLEEAVQDRVNRLRRAGGLRGMKALLGMGCRMPLPEPNPEALYTLPLPEP